MRYVTVILAKSVAPGGRNEIHGILVRLDAVGVVVQVQHFGAPASDHFFPAHMVLRIDYGSEVRR